MREWLMAAPAWRKGADLKFISPETMSLNYSIYGLSVRSNRAIPGLVASTPAPQIDLQIWLDAMPARLISTAQDRQTRYVSPEREDEGKPGLIIWSLEEGRYFHLCYADETEFVIDRKGTEIWAAWPDSLTLEDAATYLLGPVMGFALLLRGSICLHASAIAVGDQAIALLGPSGSGKSTTAAAFARSGYGVLAEDAVALARHGDIFFAQPSYPLIRLWSESVSALYGAEDALPFLTPNWNKRYLDLTTNGHRFHEEPLPLAAIYLLGERNDDAASPFLKPAPDREGLIALVANTYATRLMDKAMRAHEFELLGQLRASVPLRLVTPHSNPAYLSKLCRVILDDFHDLILQTAQQSNPRQGANV
jgi:hypothetical protein